MKHCIIVKFKDSTKVDFQRIADVFGSASSIPGVKTAVIRRNCIDRENRWDMMIEIEMDKESLPLYDSSKMHMMWKEEFAEEIEKKAIFDYDE